MSSRGWMILTIALTLLGGGGFVAINAWLDVYGVFRSTHGRSLSIYDAERRAKYLLATHYVPENFDAILIGSSVTGNWKTSEIHAHRTYNMSTNGGNISEEKVLVERLMTSGKVELAICLVHPYLTASHGLNTQEMSEREYWGALGSTSLLRTYKTMAFVHTGHELADFDDHGAQHGEAPRELNPELKRLLTPGTEVTIDETALSEYRALIALLRSQGVKLVALVPPTSEGLLEMKRPGMDHYGELMRAVFEPEDAFIDMNAPEYADIRSNPGFYTDGVHFTQAGAAEVVRRLAERLAAPAGSVREVAGR